MGYKNYRIWKFCPSSCLVYGLKTKRLRSVFLWICFLKIILFLLTTRGPYAGPHCVDRIHVECTWGDHWYPKYTTCLTLALITMCYSLTSSARSLVCFRCSSFLVCVFSPNKNVLESCSNVHCSSFVFHSLWGGGAFTHLLPALLMSLWSLAQARGLSPLLTLSIVKNKFHSLLDLSKENRAFLPLINFLRRTLIYLHSNGSFSPT